MYTTQPCLHRHVSPVSAKTPLYSNFPFYEDRQAVCQTEMMIETPICTLWLYLPPPPPPPPPQHTHTNWNRYLCTGDADLRPSIDVDATVRVTTDAAAHHVGDAHNQCSPLLAVAQGHQCVCCLTCIQAMNWQHVAGISPFPVVCLLLCLFLTHREYDLYIATYGLNVYICSGFVTFLILIKRRMGGEGEVQGGGGGGEKHRERGREGERESFITAVMYWYE